MANSAEFKLSLENIKLDDLTTITLSTESLRLNFEIILHTLKTFTKRIDANEHELRETSSENHNHITQLNERMQSLESKESETIKETDNRIKELEKQNQDILNKLNELTNAVDLNKTDINTIKEDIAGLKAQFQGLANDISQTKLAVESFQSQPQVQVQPQVDLSPYTTRLDAHDKSLQDMFDRIRRIGYTLNKLSAREQEADKGEGINDEYNDILESIMEELGSLKQSVGGFEEFKFELKEILNGYATKKDLEDAEMKNNMALERHQHSIDDIYNMFEELKSKINNKVDYEGYDEHLNDYNRMKMIVINLVNTKLSDDGQKSDLLNQLNNGGGGGLSAKEASLLKEVSTKFPEFEILLKKIQKDLGDHLYQYKIFSEETNKKTSFLDDNLRRFRDETQKKIHALEDALKALQTTVEKIDNQKANQNLGAGNNRDLNKITTNTLNELSANVKKIQSQVLVILDSDKERETKIQKLFDEVSEIKQLKIRVNNLNEFANDNRSKISYLEEELTEFRALRERIEILEAAMQKESKKTVKKNDDHLNQALAINIDEVKKLIHEAIEALREDLTKLMEDLKGLLGKKVDAEDLWKSESLILEKLDQVVGGLIKKLADKSDTKKALVFLEKKIKDISILIFGDPSQGEDGAMFAKKPLNPWACASCDTKLQKYPGSLVEHKSWNKLPPTDANPENLTQGKFGKGWNRWADKQKTQDKFRESAKDQQFRSTIDNLPDIHHQSNTSLKEDPPGMTKYSGKQDYGTNNYDIDEIDDSNKRSFSTKNSLNANQFFY